jgi:hypothetical protein
MLGFSNQNGNSLDFLGNCGKKISTSSYLYLGGALLSLPTVGAVALKLHDDIVPGA